MSDTHSAHEHGGSEHAAHDHGHGHISDMTFMKVFGALLVLTALSFGAYSIFKQSPVISFMAVGLIACCKAVLVMYFFMHLKLDWKNVFVFLIPICILAPMVIMVLWPDIVLAWRLASPE